MKANTLVHGTNLAKEFFRLNPSETSVHIFVSDRFSTVIFTKKDANTVSFRFPSTGFSR